MCTLRPHITTCYFLSKRIYLYRRIEWHNVFIYFSLVNVSRACVQVTTRCRCLKGATTLGDKKTVGKFTRFSPEGKLSE